MTIVKKSKISNTAGYKYFKRVKGKERGLVKIAFDAVNLCYSVRGEIVRRGDIPGDLANAFKRVYGVRYGVRLKKMEETAKKARSGNKRRGKGGYDF